jgi:hypothetical protein
MAVWTKHQTQNTMYVIQRMFLRATGTPNWLAMRAWESQYGTLGVGMRARGRGRRVKRTAAHEERGEGHALGTHLVAENLDGQQGLERGPADGVSDLEEVDPGEHGLADGGGDALGGSLVLAILDVGNGGRNDDGDPAETAHDVDGEQHGTTADLVDDGGTDTGENDLDSVHAERDVHLRLALLDTGGVKESGEVVGDDA